MFKTTELDNKNHPISKIAPNVAVGVFGEFSCISYNTSVQFSVEVIVYRATNVFGKFCKENVLFSTSSSGTNPSKYLDMIILDKNKSKKKNKARFKMIVIVLQT